MFINSILQFFSRKAGYFYNISVSDIQKENDVVQKEINDILCNHIVGNASDFGYWMNNGSDENYEPKILNFSPFNIFDYVDVPPGYEIDSYSNGWFYDHGEITSKDFDSKEEAMSSMWEDYSFENIRNDNVINPFEYWAISDELASMMESMPDEHFIVMHDIADKGVNVWIRRYPEMKISEDTELERLVEKMIKKRLALSK